MSSKEKHLCIAEFCQKCKQDHCKCTPCSSVQAAVEGRASEQRTQLPEIKESWILKKKDGWFCSSCRLYYDEETKICWKCGSMVSRRTYYQRTQVEAITATLIWGVLTAGIVWAIMLAGKIFLNLRYHPPLIYDPNNPALADPNDCHRTSSTFVLKEFWPALITVPLAVIVVVVAIAVIFFFGAMILGVLKNIF
jgi:hypothetical protein